MGQWIDNARKIVFSRTRKTVRWHGSLLFSEFDPARVDALKRASGKNMLLLGSGEITRLMARHRLVDEYQFGVVPVILGTGQKLLEDGPLRLSLVESRPCANGTVLLRYTPSR